MGNGKEKQAKPSQQFLWQPQGDELALYPEQPDYLIEPVESVEYSYDAVGNRVQMTADGQVTNYTYDQANRLTSAGADTFWYDPNGNLIEQDNEHGIVKYSYTGDNKLQGVYYPDGTKVEYQYDGMRQKMARTQQSYDPAKIAEQGNEVQQQEQQPKQQIEHQEQQTQHQPNGKSNAKAKEPALKGKQNAITRGNGEKKGLFDNLLSTETTFYLYDGLNVMKEYGEHLEPLAQYYEGDDGEVVSRKTFGNHDRKIDGYEGNIKTEGGLAYYMSDAIGNVTDVTDRNGNDVMKFRYDAFGNLFTQMAAPYNSVGFTGKAYDPKASLMDFSSRWYSPKQGRFTTEDTHAPVLDMPQTLNAYVYAGNNPVNYTDPTGEYYWCEATVGGKSYSHAPPCDDMNHQVWIPDPATGGGNTGGGSTGGSTGGSIGGSTGSGSTGGGNTGGNTGGSTGGNTGGGSYTPPPPPPPTPTPPTPKEIKAQKQSSLVSLAGVGTTSYSSMTRVGTTGKPSYSYVPQPRKLQQTVMTSGSQQWSSYYMNTSANKVDRYTNMTSSFLGPSQSAARSSKAIHVMASTAKAVYNLLIGDDISTLSDPNASTFSKILAGADIASNFFPVGAFGKIGGELAIKGGLKAAKLLKEPAKAAIQAGKDAVVSGVKKFVGWFGKSKKVVPKGTEKVVEGYKPSPIHSTTTESKIPTKSEPNSSIDRVDGNGNVVSRRYFDENGLAKKDVDFTDHGYPKDHPEVPHEHDWDWSNSDKPLRSK